MSPKTLFDSPYLSLAFHTSWYYCLWFAPNPTGFLGLTSIDITYMWLLTLGFTSLFLFALPFAVKRHDTGLFPTVVPACSAVLAASTLFACLAMPFLDDGAFRVAQAVVPLLFGLVGALMWIFEGASCSRAKASFSVREAFPAFALPLLAALAIAMALPTPAAAAFTAALPLASCLSYRRTMARAGGCPEPVMLPKKSRASLVRSAFVLCLACGVMYASDSFACAIIPDSLTGVGASASVLTWTLAGGVVIISAALLIYISRFKDETPYALVPVLMALSVAAIAFVVKGGGFAAVAFTLGLGICVIMELLMVTFFGALAAKGYLASAVAFGIAGGVARIAGAAGDAAAVWLEQNNLAASPLVNDICLAAICVMAFLIIAAVNQQRAIAQLAEAPLSPDGIARVCAESAEQFGLSPREAEVLGLIAQGESAEGIAKRLVISPYTAQTHIQRIYRKMHVHKRSELIDYINLRRSSEKK